MFILSFEGPPLARPQKHDQGSVSVILRLRRRLPEPKDLNANLSTNRCACAACNSVQFIAFRAARPLLHSNSGWSSEINPGPIVASAKDAAASVSGNS